MDLRVPSGWAGYAIGDRLSDRYGAPTWIDNEVNLTALGEVGVRAESSMDDLISLKLDAGIGAGLVSEGRVVHGRGGVAGEIGHLRATDDPGIHCWCGNHGCPAAIGDAVAALVTVMKPDVLVIGDRGGGRGEVDAPIRARLETTTFPPARRSVRIEVVTDECTVDSPVRQRRRSTGSLRRSMHVDGFAFDAIGCLFGAGDEALQGSCRRSVDAP